jgi:hypothetical protein
LGKGCKGCNGNPEMEAGQSLLNLSCFGYSINKDAINVRNMGIFKCLSLLTSSYIQMAIDPGSVLMYLPR